jgi:hypothetical protein
VHGSTRLGQYRRGVRRWTSTLKDGGGGSYDEEKHPRDAHGHFINTDKEDEPKTDHTHGGKYQDTAKMSRAELLKELKDHHGYDGPVSYTKGKLAEIVHSERAKTEEKLAPTAAPSSKGDEQSPTPPWAEKPDQPAEAQAPVQGPTDPSIESGAGDSVIVDQGKSESSAQEYTGKSIEPKTPTAAMSTVAMRKELESYGVKSTGKETGNELAIRLNQERAKEINEKAAAGDPVAKSIQTASGFANSSVDQGDTPVSTGIEIADSAASTATEGSGFTQHQAVEAITNKAIADKPENATNLLSAKADAHSVVEQNTGVSYSKSGAEGGHIPEASTGPANPAQDVSGSQVAIEQEKASTPEPTQYKDLGKMTRNEMVKELKEVHGYTGPTSYTKGDLGKIVEFQRQKTEAAKSVGTGHPTASPTPGDGKLNLLDTDVRKGYGRDAEWATASNNVAQKLNPAERSAVLSYSGNGYHQLNDAMRNGTMNPSQKGKANAIERAISKTQGTAYKPPPAVWRKISVPGGAKNVGSFVEKNYPTGATIGFKSFTSTTHSPGTFSTLNNGHGQITFEIHTMQNNPRNIMPMTSSSMTHHVGENEHLMSPNAKFKVIGVKDVPRSANPYNPAETKTVTAKVVQLVQIG